MGSLRGMWCPLGSVCWFMLPAFPISPPVSQSHSYSAGLSCVRSPLSLSVRLYLEHFTEVSGGSRVRAQLHYKFTQKTRPVRILHNVRTTPSELFCSSWSRLWNALQRTPRRWRFNSAPTLPQRRLCSWIMHQVRTVADWLNHPKNIVSLNDWLIVCLQHAQIKQIQFDSFLRSPLLFTWTIT